jgi:uncharacterized protein YceK
MKQTLQVSLFVIAVVALLLCGCSTGRGRSSQASHQSADEFQGLDSIVNDRHNWVDPALLF